MRQVSEGNGRGAGLRRIARLSAAIFLTGVMLLAATPDASAANTWSHNERWWRAYDVYFGGTSQFMQHRNSNHSTGIDSTMIWSSDGCGGMPTILNHALNPWMPFLDQCRQHDFGYANFGNLYTPAWYKSNIDAHFYWRMNARCGAWWIRYSGNEPKCQAGAITFYIAVYYGGNLGSSGRCGFEWQRHNCLNE